jgi:tetratricopeptide (TPR) repeat protein
VDVGALDVLRARAYRNLHDAAEQARRRFAIDKALRLIRQADSIANGPIERASALERLGIAAINSYQGDLAWRSLREAADLLIEHAPNDRAAIARVCANAVEPPTRWPGSMADVPTEAEISSYIQTGFANARAEDESLVRLLTARAFGPFSFGGGRKLRPGEYEAARMDGRRAAEIAMRIGRPDLASAALDAIGSAGITLGLYAPNVEMIDRRLELVEVLDSPWEIGDIFAVGAWFWTNLGDFGRAIELAREGWDRLDGVDAATGVRIHCLCWQAQARFFVGEWSAVTDDILLRVLRLLGDRRDEPPYFTAPLLGPAAFIKAARGDDDAGWLADLIGRMGRHQGHRSVALGAWSHWIKLRRGAVDAAFAEFRRIDDVPVSAFRPLTLQLWAEAIADAGVFADATELLETGRAFARAGGLEPLDAHLDALEGRAALAAGDAGRAVELLEQARARLERLGARWDSARTDLSLAEAFAADRPADARERLRAAMREFERVGSRFELERGNPPAPARLDLGRRRRRSRRRAIR